MLELAAKLDSARWSKITHGVNVHLDAGEMDTARDALREVAALRSLVERMKAQRDEAYDRAAAVAIARGNMLEIHSPRIAAAILALKDNVRAKR